MKRKQIVGTVVLAAMSVGIGCIVILVLRPPLWYYTSFARHPRLLPSRLVKPALRFATGRDLPPEVESMAGIVQGGRDPSIFVRFRTDDAGVQHVLREFGGPDTTSEVLGDGSLRSGWNAFFVPSQWQEQLEVRLYDQDKIHSARLITRISIGGQDFDPGYVVLIDDENREVYIYAHPWQ